MQMMNCLVTLWALGIVTIGCGDTEDKTPMENDTGSETDTDTGNDNENDTDPLGIGACTSENIIGRWELNYPENEFVEAHTEQYAFFEDGTFENDDTIGSTLSGTWKLLTGGLELTLQNDESSAPEGSFVLVVTCASVDGKLYVDKDMINNPDAKAESLDGAWSEHAASVTWDVSISMVVDGDSFSYEEIETGKTIVKASGNVRADGNKVYWTYTSVDIDPYDEVELNKEDFLGIRIAKDVIFWVSDESENPSDFAYTKID